MTLHLLDRFPSSGGKRSLILSRSASQKDHAYLANMVGLNLMAFAIFTIDLFEVIFGKVNVNYDDIITLNILISLILFPLSFFYIYVRFDKDISSVLYSIAMISLLTPLLCFMTYFACSYGSAFPLRDDDLASFDHSIGFSWPHYLELAKAHPMWSNIGRFAYLSVFPQAVMAILTLSITKQAERLQVVIYAFVIGALICSVCSCVMPALGAYQYFAIDPASHADLTLQVRSSTVSTVLELRSGSFRLFSAADSKGIISFPSFHTVLGLLMIWAFWTMRRLRWISVVLNAMLIAATPLQGSHYLADVLAGGLVGLIAILLGKTSHSSLTNILVRPMQIINMTKCGRASAM